MSSRLTYSLTYRFFISISNFLGGCASVLMLGCASVLMLGCASVLMLGCASVLMLGCASFLMLGCASFDQGPAPKKFVIEKNWVRSTLKQEFAGFRRMNRFTPVVAGNVLIEGNAVDGIVAYDKDSGTQLWRMNLQNGVEGGAAVSGNHLYFGSSNGGFYCVQVGDGKVLWTIPVKAETLAAPTVEGNVVYFESGADIVYALDAASGKQLWYYNRQITTNFAIRATTRPVISGDAILVGFSDGFLVSLKKSDGTLLWEHKLGRAPRFKDIDTTPVVDNASIFVASFDGTLFSLKKETGEVNWQFDEGGYVPVTLAGDQLYFSTISGHVIALDKNTGKQHWVYHLKRGIATQPAMFRGYLAFGESEGALTVVDSANGEVIGQYFPGRGLVAAPLVDENSGNIYFMSNNANLYSMKMGFKRESARLPWQND